MLARRAEHHGQRLEEDRAGHLRLAHAPIDERDRDLDDGSAAAQRAVGHLDLESVSARAHRAEIEPPQDSQAAVDAIRNGNEGCRKAIATGRSDKNCDKVLNSAVDRRNQHETLQTIGLVALGAGAVAAGVGAALLLTSGDPNRYDQAPRDPAPPLGFALSGWAGQDGGGILVAGTF